MNIFTDPYFSIPVMLIGTFISSCITSVIWYYRYSNIEKSNKNKETDIEYKVNKLSLTADIGIVNDLKPIAKVLIIKIDYLIHTTMKEYNHSKTYQDTHTIDEIVDDIIDKLLKNISTSEDKFNNMNSNGLANHYSIMNKIFIKNYSMLYQYIFESCAEKADSWYLNYK